MTKDLEAIWRLSDRIIEHSISQRVQDEEVNQYLDDNYYIIPEEDWDEIQTRGYDIELMMSDADEKHCEDESWIDAVKESLVDQGDKCLAGFWRGYNAGTEISDIHIEELGINGSDYIYPVS